MNEQEIKELKQKLKDHGYTLEKVTHFNRFDRVTFGNKQLKMSINLRGKLSELALETVINACIGKDVEE